MLWPEILMLQMLLQEEEQLRQMLERRIMLLRTQVLEGKGDKSRREWKTELSLRKPILNQNIKSRRKMNLIGNKHGTYCSIKCKNLISLVQNKSWLNKTFYIKRLNSIEKWGKKYLPEILSHFLSLEEEPSARSGFVGISRQEKSSLSKEWKKQKWSIRTK